MGMKVLQWSQSASCSQTLASVISSPSSNRQGRGHSGTFVCRYLHRFGTQSTKLHRSQSYEYPKSRFPILKRACSASRDVFSDEEFSKKIQELALKFQLSGDDNDNQDEVMVSESEVVVKNQENFNNTRKFPFSYSKLDSMASPWSGIRNEPLDWGIERKANSVDLPLSLLIIKRKMKWQENITEAGESAYCSVKRAFSSMVFMIQELHSYTLQMRGFLCQEDLQGIMIRVQKEMQASFVWLFQQVFSHTPTLMIYVMILLANFTVHSMSNNTAIAVSHVVPMESISVNEIQDHETDQKFDSSMVKTFSVSVGGNSGDGGKILRVSSGTDENGGGSDALQLLNQVKGEEEVRLWNSIVEEAATMQTMDQDTMKKFVSPVNAKIEAEEYADYFRTELLYQMGLSQNPNHSLLLANFAQFLFLVAHDYDRAEEYFKRAVMAEPPDAEAFSKYASFLWRVRNDLWAAEETFLVAIAAEPTNTYYAANYAHFLWNTGGEDTCFPLDSPDISAQQT